jgi:YVTN family beta-propeller protein
VTQAAGYVLSVPPGQLDACRFEALLEQGRRELAHGDAELAAGTLRSALALWRGPPLADLAYQRFAQSEISRLEELRLTALEERIEAELTLGRSDALVPELEALIAQHPYRERLRAQLMLALYRCGRQAEALDTYRRAHRVMAAELGIEPGPRLRELERAVLRHDPSLEVPIPRSTRFPRIERAKAARWSGRLWKRRALVVAVALVIAIVASVLAVRRDPPNHLSPVPMKLVGNSVAVVDAETNAVMGEIPVGGRPSGIAVGAGSVWVGNRDDKTLLRIDPRSRKVARTIGLGVAPTDLGVGAGSVWVLSDSPDAILRIDPSINEVVATIPLRRRNVLDPPWSRLAVGTNAVWVCACWMTHGALSRIDPATNSVVLLREGPVSAIASGEGALWALTGYENNTVERINASTSAIAQSIPLGRVGETTGGYGARIAAGAGGVWTVAYAGTTLWKIDPATGRFIGSVRLGRTPHGVATGNGAVWVVAGDGILFRIDPALDKVDETIPLGAHPAAGAYSIAVGEGAVWVAITP